MGETVGVTQRIFGTFWLWGYSRPCTDQSVGGNRAPDNAKPRVRPDFVKIHPEGTYADRGIESWAPGASGRPRKGAVKMVTSFTVLEAKTDHF